VTANDGTQWWSAGTLAGVADETRRAWDPRSESPATGNQELFRGRRARAWQGAWAGAAPAGAFNPAELCYQPDAAPFEVSATTVQTWGWAGTLREHWGGAARGVTPWWGDDRPRPSQGLATELALALFGGRGWLNGRLGGKLYQGQGGDMRERER